MLAASEKGALVTTLFTVVGKQVLHAKPEFKDYVDATDGTPPQTAQLIVAAEHSAPGTPARLLATPTSCPTLPPIAKRARTSDWPSGPIG